MVSHHIKDMERTAMSVKSFYGESPSGTTKKNFFRNLKKRKKIEEREKAYKERPLSDLQLYVKVFSERKIWKWFGRQQDALDFCLEMKETPLRLLAYEKADSKRKFLVTTLKQFWKRYSEMHVNERHFYEFIGVDDSCRLYFDIEFQRDLNPEVNGPVVLDIFIKYVCYCLYKEFNINCTRSNIVDLDSTTESKFSRHLLFHLEGNAVFINNVNCGMFVKDICYCLKTFLETGKSNKFLPVTPKGDNKENWLEASYLLPDLDLRSLMVKSSIDISFLCDLGVYSKNRNFRLYKSSKVAKNIPLVIANENEFTFTTKLTKKERKRYRHRGEIFDPDFQLFCDTLVCNNCSNIKTLSYGDNVILPVNKIYILKPYKDGAQSSPFPKLDRFVLNHARENCKHGVIKKWLLFDSKVIIYGIGDNRWCGNIQREHKSNQPYYVADLIVKHLYQKCHDPDCMNFRSSGVYIPDDVNPIIENVEAKDFNLSKDVELNKIFSTDFDFEDINNWKSVDLENEDVENQHKDQVVSCNEQNILLQNDKKLEEYDNIDDKELGRLFDEDFVVPEFTGCDDNDDNNNDESYVSQGNSTEECNDEMNHEILFSNTDNGYVNTDCGATSINENDNIVVIENVIDVIDSGEVGYESVNLPFNNDNDRDYDQNNDVSTNDSLQYTNFPSDIDFSELMEKTTHIYKDFPYDLSDVDQFSLPLSPSMVSFNKPYKYTQNVEKSQSSIVSKSVSSNSEFDSKILNELFSGENSDNEFSAIL